MVAAPVYRGREPAFAAVTLDGFGRVAFHDKKNAFEAKCSRHQECSMSRTASSVRGGGRPLGLLCAWLQMPAGTKHEHKDLDAMNTYLTLARRQAARAALLELPGGQRLSQQERARRDDEPEEPIQAK